MWYAKLNRREIMDVLVTGWRPELSRMEEGGQLSFLDGAGFLAVWHDSSSTSVDSLPCLIASNESSIAPLLAALLSAPQLPFPITSLSRLVTNKQLSAMAEMRGSDTRSSLLNGLACLAIAEATIYAGQDAQSENIGVSVCSRTISHAFGKAIQIVPEDEIQEFLRRWMEVQAITGAPLLAGAGTSETLSRIFDVCISVNLGKDNGDTLADLVSDAVKYGEPSDANWRRITGAVLEGSLQDFSNGTREERGTGFQSILEKVRTSKDPPQELLAACALVATRISPGTMDHLNLLLRNSNPSVVLWYAFFAGIQRFGSALRQRQGRGLRILRDMRLSSDLFSEPRADIAYDEFILANKLEIDSVSKRMTHSNEIVIELYPHVDVSFRYGRRSGRGAVSVPQDSEVAKQELANEILSAAKSLELLAGRVLAPRNVDSPAPRARGGRQKRLL